MLGNPEDAEDVVQSLFVEWMSTGRTDVSLPYFYRAATSRCLNRLRDSRRRRRLLDRHGADTLVVGGGDLAQRLLTWDLLAKLLDRLDASEAEVFVYVFLDRMSLVRTADIMGIHRKTVAVRVARIRDVLDELAAVP